VRKLVAKLRAKNLHTWLPAWLAERARTAPRRARRAAGPRHLLFALCDHYEPLHGQVDHARGVARVEAWRQGYPALARRFTDADGFHPRHSFFFPGEQYHADFLDPLAELGRGGFGEVELHLHHDGDTSAKLRRDLHDFLGKYARHGHLARDPDGRLRYAFIHGNWCLANARKDGRWCGVDDEIPLLHDTGCYADFTFPAAPDESQPRIVNQIYWPEGELARRRGYERGVRARVGETRDDRLLFIEGPIALAPARPPRFVSLESGDLTGHNPGSAARVRTWVAQDIHIEGRPEWVFVKVHTHGAPEKNGPSLLGAGGEALHRALAAYNDGTRWKLHYVTAREMYNIAIAAMEGKSGDPAEHRDHRLPPPPVAR
jgi:hypothetical protein